MGVVFSTSQPRSAFYQGGGAACPADRLRVDEERADLGGPGFTDWRDRDQSPAAALVRQRLLARLIGGDTDEAEQLAATLIAAFGSVGSVIAAPSTTLSRFIDDPRLVFRLAAAKELVMDELGDKLRRARFDISDRLVQLWVISLFKERRTERVHLALLGEDMQLLGEERLFDGNLSNVRVNLRTIVSRGIDAGASAVVLMHNHPSGNPQPSAADVDETRKIAALLKPLDLELQDHLIVGGNTIFSMRGAKLI